MVVQSVAIFLYALSALFALGLGNGIGRGSGDDAVVFGVIMVVSSFALAVTLQVFG